MKTIGMTKEERSILIVALSEYENRMATLKIESERVKAMNLRYKLLKQK